RLTPPEAMQREQVLSAYQRRIGHKRVDAISLMDKTTRLEDDAREIDKQAQLASDQRWFLSYNAPDQAVAERLKAAIERKSSRSRVFFAATHLRAGGVWSSQPAQEIAEATAFILLVGKHGIGPWQVLEYDEALDKRVSSPNFPIIVVLLEGQTAPGLPFLR